MLIYCFEDERVEKLAPIIHARPAYAITCAGYRLVDWLHELQRQSNDARIVGDVRSYLQAIQVADYGLDLVPHSIVSPDPSAADISDVLLVNARLVPSVGNLQSLRQLVHEQRFAVIMSSGDGGETEMEPDGDAEPTSAGVVLAAWLPAAEVAKSLGRAAKVVAEQVDAAMKLEGGRRKASRESAPTPAYAALCRHAATTASRSSLRLHELRWPHDVVSAHMKCISGSIEYRISVGNYSQLEDGVFVGAGVSLGEYESIQTAGGAIVLDDNVQVGPFCYLEGPMYAGANTRVIEHSSIKDGVSLGHTAKIGGEVEASVIEPFTNKQHHGFLGHSYLGSWINLGAGTCNSDLKNTYGKINIQYGEEKIATGMQFLGCIMGDYSKSAINTGIFTGKVIGVCSMMYGFVTGNVPSYVNYARLFGQTSLLPPEVMVSTQARMFARRKTKQRQEDIDLIHAMYHRTETERLLSDQLGF
ncbi:putative sugar nucleotidyl transferase [Allorhodopirellula heiligendammensis]|uniref:Bifunctional protein GlmU n=1 Tax=Allorhodopirellula heiligendammensis TaxID=2714739 RepID=A0A5C6BTJ9_9BACT|nr:putative sugar nucleotidyl transferase [Allorhodopirellula heiligendammensis]TWU15345.1 Bifunctional protein GlmU [Allorhodopirellula heiligendammensis]